MKEYHILKQKDLMLIISRNSTCHDVNHRIFIGHPSLRPIREAMKKFLEEKKMKNFEVPLLETEIKTNLSQEINKDPRTFDSQPKIQGKNGHVSLGPNNSKEIPRIFPTLESAENPEKSVRKDLIKPHISTASIGKTPKSDTNLSSNTYSKKSGSSILANGAVITSKISMQTQLKSKNNVSVSASNVLTQLTHSRQGLKILMNISILVSTLEYQSSDGSDNIRCSFL